MVRDYRDLKVWQKAMDLAKAVYDVTQTFPSEQRYVLAVQMQRAVISFPSNIAEGQTRHSENDFLYVNIAKGSLAELETQLTLAWQFGFLSEEEHDRLLGMSKEIMKMLYGLRASLESYSKSKKAKTYDLEAMT